MHKVKNFPLRTELYVNIKSGDTLYYSKLAM